MTPEGVYSAWEIPPRLPEKAPHPATSSGVDLVFGANPVVVWTYTIWTFQLHKHRESFSLKELKSAVIPIEGEEFRDSPE